MTTTGRVGRPKASSRETLAEAACELFLEQGFDATSIIDITTRAGVSRSSFFNYFASKADVLWAALDERLDAAATALQSTDDSVPDVLAAIVDGFEPDSLALAIAHARAMGIEAELERERAVRQYRLARAVAHRLERDGGDVLRAEVTSAASAGAVFAALWRWAEEGPRRLPLGDTVRAALQFVPAT